MRDGYLSLEERAPKLSNIVADFHAVGFEWFGRQWQRFEGLLLKLTPWRVLLSSGCLWRRLPGWTEGSTTLRQDFCWTGILVETLWQ